jgi:hypothetical protein
MLPHARLSCHATSVATDSDTPPRSPLAYPAGPTAQPPRHIAQAEHRNDADAMACPLTPRRLHN